MGRELSLSCLNNENESHLRDLLHFELSANTSCRQHRRIRWLLAYLLIMQWQVLFGLGSFCPVLSFVIQGYKGQVSVDSWMQRFLPFQDRQNSMCRLSGQHRTVAKFLCCTSCGLKLSLTTWRWTFSAVSAFSVSFLKTLHEQQSRNRFLFLSPFPGCDLSRRAAPSFPLVRPICDVQLVPKSSSRTGVQPLQLGLHVPAALNCHHHHLFRHCAGDVEEKQTKSKWVFRSVSSEPEI